MKKFLIVLPFFLLIFLRSIFAQTATSSSQEKQQIEEFKEKIATKVAQLQKKVNNKAIAGFIESINDNNLKLKTQDNELFTVNTDSLITKYYQIKGNKKIEIGFSDIKKDDYIVVSGLIDDKKITANFIYVDEPYLSLTGKVMEVNKSEYSLKILTNEKENYIIDIETTTKQLILDIKTLNLEKTGFSKIKEGDIIYFVIKNFKEKKERYSAEKILIIPQEYFIK